MCAFAVRLENVNKSFGHHRAVDGLNLDVGDGSIYGFIGPNGSGKTTTLRMILHIIHPDNGRIEVFGDTMRRAANDTIGYLPEERGLYRKISVARQLAYFARLKGLPRSEVKQSIDDWLDRMDLGDWKNQKMETLSKGMVQKVQFISAVIARPRLLILDEPFSGLDPVNTEIIREIIIEMSKGGTTVILSTHDMSVAEKMCDSIFMIFKGRKVLDGRLTGIQNQYGEDTIRLRMNGSRQIDLKSVRGVIDVRDFGRYQEVRFEGESQSLLKDLIVLGEVRHFEVVRPSLNDIFIRIAGPQTEIEEMEKVGKKVDGTTDEPTELSSGSGVAKGET